MGLFDHVHADDERFTCSEGHQLCEFQSKDFGCTMGDVTISGDQLAIENGGWGDPPVRPLLGRFEISGSCDKCPAFVQARTCNLIDMCVTFEIEVVDDVIRKVTRIGPTTAEWLKTAPKLRYLAGAQGPMPWEEAMQLHIKGDRTPWPRDDE